MPPTEQPQTDGGRLNVRGVRLSRRERVSEDSRTPRPFISTSASPTTFKTLPTVGARINRTSHEPQLPRSPPTCIPLHTKSTNEFLLHPPTLLNKRADRGLTSVRRSPPSCISRVVRCLRDPSTSQAACSVLSQFSSTLNGKSVLKKNTTHPGPSFSPACTTYHF